MDYRLFHWEVMKGKIVLCHPEAGTVEKELSDIAAPWKRVGVVEGGEEK